MVATKSSSQTGKKKTVIPKTCPTCGGMECFERPRYFGGQLLTDRDLDAAQRYVIEKNKLRNRHLVGTGVVCGLAVRLHPTCEGSVVVESGYAIDCCGNDIVLCDPAEFDVLKYIKDLQLSGDPYCGEKITSSSVKCDEGSKTYRLLLFYDEQPTKPITALIRDNGCSNSRCEPSRTLEFYRLELVEQPDKLTAEARGLSAQISSYSFVDSVLKCLQQWQVLRAFAKAGQSYHKELLENKKLQTYYDSTKHLLNEMERHANDLYKSEPKLRGDLQSRMDAIKKSFPEYIAQPGNLGEYMSQINKAVIQMLALNVQFLFDCICDALLVPCMECHESEGILLAHLTIREQKIEKICNIVRQQILTAPALQYWLGSLYGLLGKLLQDLCCNADWIDRLEPILSVKDQETIAPDNAFARAEDTYNAVRSFAARTSENIQGFNWVQMVRPENITVMEIFDRPLAEVKSLLNSKGITNITEITAKTKAQAYSLGNLGRMSWVIQPNSQVELIVSPEQLVTGIRVVGGQ
jgi:hypothetical protein